MSKIKDITNKRFFEIIEEANGAPLKKVDILNLISACYRFSAGEAERLGLYTVVKAETERATAIYNELHALGYYDDIEAEISDEELTARVIEELTKQF